MTTPTPVTCDGCGKYLGWYYSNQPKGCLFCNECHAIMESEK